MLNTKSTADLVKSYLEDDLFLLEVLKEDLVNYSALARKLLPAIKKENKEATAESIMVSAKRFITKEKKNKISNVVNQIIQNSQLSTKNDVVHLTFKRNEPVIKEILKASLKINWSDDEVFFINQGSGEVTIILDKRNKSLLDACKEHLIEKTEDLAILSVKESFTKDLDESINVPGVYSYFINQLSRRSINIIEIISTYSQLTLVFKNEDLIQAYSTLNNKISALRKKGNT